MEIDLATESPAAILEQCRRYHEYYRSGLEQKEFGVFPLTVWVVSGPERKATLLSKIASTFPKAPRLFTVITPAELTPLITQGLTEAKLC